MHPSIDARLRKFTSPFTISAPLLGVLGIIVLVLGLIGAWQARPYVLWAYNLQRASAYREYAFTYPQPRHSDSLPTLTNPEANQTALGHLAAAIQWRPHDPYAYRLAGEHYLAAGDLLDAVSIMETGLERAGSDILTGWQLALAYEQVQERVAQQPGENLVPLFAEATPDAPLLEVETPFCTTDDPRSCYSGSTTYTRAYAAYSDAGKVMAETLFLHPPARVTIPIEIPTGQSALTFLMGLDPLAQTWGTDGATFQIWIVEPDGGILPVYERTVIGGELTRGWVPDSIDLTPWAGQSIQLALGTTAGPLNDNTGDWVGFGNVYLTDHTTAAYRALQPEGKFGEALQKVTLPPAQLVERGDEELYASRFDEAAQWYRRAQWSGEAVTSTLAYAQFLEIQQNEGWDAAFPYLETAVKSDQGWGSNINRFYTFYNYGRWFTEQEVFWESEGYLRVALSIFPDPPHPLYPAVSDAHRLLSVGYNREGRFEEALTHAREALTYNSNSYLTQYQYGYALHRYDPTRLPEVEQAFARSLELDSGRDNWRNIILVWLESGDSARAENYCATALQTYSPEELEFTCWQGSGGASAILFGEYFALLDADDEVGAYAKLSEAVASDGGWSNAGQRFDAWLKWTEYLVEEARYEEAVVAGEQALAIMPDYISLPVSASLNELIATALVGSERYQEALPYFEAVLLYDDSPFNHFYYATIRYQSNPDDIATIRNLFADVLSDREAQNEMRIWMIDFWYQVAQAEEAATLCAGSALSAAERSLCVPSGATVTSGRAFEAYQVALEQGDSEEAQRQLEDAVGLDEGWQRMGYRHRAWAAMGDYYQSAGQYESAVAAYNVALESRDPAVNRRALSIVAGRLGIAYLGIEQPDEAILAFEQAIELYEANAFAYVNLARTLYIEDSNNLTHARELFAKALEIAPEDVEVWRSVIGFWSFVANQPNEVARLCESVSESIYDAIGGLCWSGEGIASRESYNQYIRLRSSDPEAAYEALEAAIMTDGGWLDGQQRFRGWYYWGLHSLNTRQFEQAAIAFETAISFAPENLIARELSEAYRQWAIALNGMGNVSTALTQVETAILLDDTNALAYLLEGQLLYQTDQNRLVDSQRAFEEALRLEPENPVIWISEVSFWLEYDQHDLVLDLCTSAPATIQTAIDLQCWDGSTPPSTTYYRDFTREQGNSNTDAAYVALERAVEVNDGWLNRSMRYLAWRAWGMRLWQVGRHAEAVETWQITHEQAPTEIAPHLRSDDYFIMGLSLSALSRNEDALLAYEQAVTLNPDNIWARLNYGYALYGADSSNKVLVVEQFASALTTAPDQLLVWQNIIAFWQDQGESEEADAVCEQAEASTFVVELAPLCNPS